MKKIISIMLVMMFMVFAVAPLTVFAAENEVLAIIQLNVDKEIGDKNREVKVTIFETTTYEEYEVMFYPTSNYRTKIEISEGTYMVDSIYISGTSKFFDFTTPTIKATGQTVNVDIVIGNGDWDGTTSDGSVNGTIDRDKTDELMKEDGKDPIDWDKVDEEIDKFQEDVTKEDETTEPEDTTDNTPETKPDNDETGIVGPDDPDTPDDDDNTKGGTNNVIVPVLFTVAILGGGVGIIIYRKVKSGVPILPTDDE